MHERLQHFFRTHRAKTSEHRRAIHAQLDPIANAGAEIQRHLLELRLALEAAERSALDGQVDSTLEWLHSQLKAAQQAADRFNDATRDVIKQLANLDAHMNRAEPELASMTTRAPHAAVPVTVELVDPAVQGPNKIEARAAAAKEPTA